eukprot:365479-Chlamydomonas_euryale.AAC.14
MAPCAGFSLEGYVHTRTRVQPLLVALSVFWYADPRQEQPWRGCRNVQAFSPDRCMHAHKDSTMGPMM